jgi:uncharacterized protein YhaN
VTERINRLIRDGVMVPELEALSVALKVVGALEERLNAQVAKVDELDRRLGEVESRLEKIAAQ